MKVLELNLDNVIRITGDPALYQHAVFLEPMRIATMNLHIKYKGCTTCQKASMRRSFQFVSNAFASLVRQEYDKTPNGLPALKDIIKKILNADFEELILRFTQGGKEQELKF